MPKNIKKLSEITIIKKSYVNHYKLYKPFKINKSYINNCNYK